MIILYLENKDILLKGTILVYDQINVCWLKVLEVDKDKDRKMYVSKDVLV